MNCHTHIIEQGYDKFSDLNHRPAPKERSDYGLTTQVLRWTNRL